MTTERVMGPLHLTDLGPASCQSPNAGADARINFLCPTCLLGRVVVDLRIGTADESTGTHGSTHLPPAYDLMTITPSVDASGRCRRGCPGWHGFIKNGAVR